mgnify:CR=1 FL=1
MGQPSQQDKVVLVVDDDDALRASLEFILGIEGYAVRTYAHGRALLDDKELPADGCLIVDQRLPDMEGLQLIDRLRQREVRLPAILITSNPTSALRLRAQLADVSIVEKPFVTGTLFQRITQMLK